MSVNKHKPNIDTGRLTAQREKIAALQRRNKELLRLSRKRARKLVKLLTSKIFMYVLLLLVQLAVLTGGILMLQSFIDTGVFLIVSGVLALFFTVFIINSNTPNEYKLIWVVFVLTLTVLGMLAYLLFGNKRMRKRKAAKIRQRAGGILAECGGDDAVLREAKERDAFLHQTARFITENGHLPLSTASGAVYFDTGEAYFERLAEELKKAESFIFLEYFIISSGRIWDGLFDILREKSRRGVEVRIIYDDLGCITALPKDFGKACIGAGIKLYCFNRLRPVLDAAQNNRTHRKIAIIDGVCAFTGGVNIGDEYANLTQKYGHWKDTGIMLTGAAVKNFTLMFLYGWAAKFGREDISCYVSDGGAEEGQKQGGEVGEKILCLPFYDMPASKRTICEQVYLKLIYNAKSYIYINTPYLIITDKMRDALEAAAGAGVDVRITVPNIPDKKTVFGLTQAFYTPLVLAGVKLYRYTPGFIHAKSIVSDDKYAVIGTSNMDFRSFYLHHECNVFIYESVCPQMRMDFEQTCGLCRLITPESVKNISVRTRIWRAFLRIFAPLM